MRVGGCAIVSCAIVSCAIVSCTIISDVYVIIIECVCDPPLLLLIRLEGVAQEARRVQGPHGRPIASRPLIGRGVGGPIQESLLFLIEKTNTIRLVMPLSATLTVDEHIAEALGAVVGDHYVSVVEGEEHST